MGSRDRIIFSFSFIFSVYEIDASSRLSPLLRKIHRYSGKTRREVYDLAQDRRLFHQFIERLWSLDDQR